MDEKVVKILEENSKKFSNQEISALEMLSAVEGVFDKCVDFDDVAGLIFDCLRDESGAGMITAKSIAAKAVSQRIQGKMGPTDRFGKMLSPALEYLILAKAFAKYSSPNDREEFMLYFDKANELASDSFDYRQLAGNLYDACRDLGEPAIDPDFVRVRSLMQRAVDLSVQENSLPGLEDMESMAKFQIKDKELTKSISALKRKLKKANQ